MKFNFATISIQRGMRTLNIYTVHFHPFNLQNWIQNKVTNSQPCSCGDAVCATTFTAVLHLWTFQSVGNQKEAEKKASCSRGVGIWWLEGEALYKLLKDLFLKSEGHSGYKTGRHSKKVMCLTMLPSFCRGKLPRCRLHFSMAMASARQQSKDGEKCCITPPFTIPPLFIYIVTNFSASNKVMNSTRAELPCCLKLLLSHLKREIQERMASIAQSIFRWETHHLIIIYLT